MYIPFIEMGNKKKDKNTEKNQKYPKEQNKDKKTGKVIGVKE